MSAKSPVPDWYEDLDEGDKQKVRDLVERLAAESDPSARAAILDEALTSARATRDLT